MDIESIEKWCNKQLMRDDFCLKEEVSYGFTYLQVLSIIFPNAVDLLWYSSNKAMNSSAEEISEKIIEDILAVIQRADVGINGSDIRSAIENGSLDAAINVLSTLMKKESELLFISNGHVTASTANTALDINVDDNIYEISEMAFKADIRWLLGFISKHSPNDCEVRNLIIELDKSEEDAWGSIKTIACPKILEALCSGILYQKAIDIIFTGEEKKANTKFQFLDTLLDHGYFKFNKNLHDSVRDIIADNLPFYESMHCNIIEALMTAGSAKVTKDTVRMELLKFPKYDGEITPPFDLDDAFLQWANLIYSSESNDKVLIEDIMDKLATGELLCYMIKYYTKTDIKVKAPTSCQAIESNLYSFARTAKQNDWPLPYWTPQELAFISLDNENESSAITTAGFRKNLMTYLCELLVVIQTVPVLKSSPILQKTKHRISKKRLKERIPVIFDKPESQEIPVAAEPIAARHPNILSAQDGETALCPAVESIDLNSENSNVTDNNIDKNELPLSRAFDLIINELSPKSGLELVMLEMANIDTAISEGVIVSKTHERDLNFFEEEVNSPKNCSKESIVEEPMNSPTSATYSSLALSLIEEEFIEQPIQNKEALVINPVITQEKWEILEGVQPQQFTAFKEVEDKAMAIELSKNVQSIPDRIDRNDFPVKEGEGKGVKRTTKSITEGEHADILGAPRPSSGKSIAYFVDIEENDSETARRKGVKSSTPKTTPANNKEEAEESLPFHTSDANSFDDITFSDSAGLEKIDSRSQTDKVAAKFEIRKQVLSNCSSQSSLAMEYDIYYPETTSAKARKYLKSPNVKSISLMAAMNSASVDEEVESPVVLEMIKKKQIARKKISVISEDGSLTPRVNLFIAEEKKEAPLTAIQQKKKEAKAIIKDRKEATKEQKLKQIAEKNDKLQFERIKREQEQVLWLQERSKKRLQEKQQPVEPASPTRNRTATASSTSTEKAKIKRLLSVSVKNAISKTLSNKLIIRNALTNICLAGTVNHSILNDVLQDLDDSSFDHYIILFHGMKNHKFRGLYAYDPTLDQVLKVYTESQGPDNLLVGDVLEFFKYDSGAREFKNLHTKSFGRSICAVSIANKKTRN